MPRFTAQRTPRAPVERFADPGHFDRPDDRPRLAAPHPIVLGWVRKGTDLPFVSRLHCRTGSGARLGSCTSGLRPSPAGRYGQAGAGKNMDTNTLLIIVLVLLVLGGGGIFYRRRA
jgi:hypothetical protein